METIEELEKLRIKATVFDLIKEKEMHLQASNYIQEEITRLVKRLEEKNILSKNADSCNKVVNLVSNKKEE